MLTEEIKMLVLSRKKSETIKIPDDVTITIVRISDGTVRIGIDAPREVRIVRGELAEVEEKERRDNANAR